LELLNQLKPNDKYNEAKVLVVSKNKTLANHTYIEVITDDGKNMRLLYLDNSNMLDDIDINIYDNLLIKYQRKKDIILPHTEDINVFYINKISANNKPMVDILKILNIDIIQGNPNTLFENKLIWSQNSWQSSGYISANDIPNYSICFWRSDKDIYLNKNNYEYILDDKTYSMRYVGMHKAQDCIYKGTLIKVSLANWWNSNSPEDNRCYLQLSEYYPLERETDILDKIASSINNKTMILVNYFVNGESIIFDNVIPYKILYLNGNHYLACKVDTAYQFTLFRVLKIRAINKSTNTFKYNQNMLDFIDYIQTPFSKYSDNFKDTMIKVKVEIDKSKASFFEIRKHLDSQKIIERKENGNIIVSFLVTQELEMEELIKKWIPYIKVLVPTSLDEKIKSDIKQYLNYYTELPWEKF
jgi:hypothetical protein